MENDLNDMMVFLAVMETGSFIFESVTRKVYDRPLVFRCCGHGPARM